MKPTVEQIQSNANSLANSFIRKGRKAGLSEDWLAISLNSMYNRGFMKDMDTHIRRLVLCQNRDNDMITKEFLGDGRASKKDNGSYFYSGTGKTAGIETWAILAKCATDEQISRFCSMLKEDKVSMRTVKNRFRENFGIDFLTVKV